MVQDPPHGVHDEREEGVEDEERRDGQVEQGAAADVVGQPVVADHEQGRRGQDCVNLFRMEWKGGGGEEREMV